MEKQYTVYQITSPCGGRYIGYTSMSLAQRWYSHKTRALSGYSPTHPFYSAIRKYSAENFSIQSLSDLKSLKEALTLEKSYIAECPIELRLNLSPGGKDDARFGGEIFWERINQNPEKKVAYLKKLSESQKLAAQKYDRSKMLQKAAEWRANHPVEVYKNATRASRIAKNRKVVKPQPDIKPTETTEERKKRLLWKFKKSEALSQSTTEVWNNRTVDDRKTIGDKISKSLKEHMANLSPEERRAVTEKARASIDRDKQGKAASQGIKRFWEELRKDPVRYQEYINRRTASLINTIKK